MALLNQAQFTPTEGGFVTSFQGEDVWIAYEGTVNRHGELSTLTTFQDGVALPPHSEPDWLFDEIMADVDRRAS